MEPLYIFLGIPKSGRREIIYNLIEESLLEGEKALVYVSENERDSAFDEQLSARPDSESISWKMEAGAIQAEAEKKEPGKESLHFFLTEGALSPMDQIEALADWAKTRSIEVARIYTVVHCQVAEKEKKLEAWYEQCIHFSDYVFLNRREDVSNKWVKAFEDGYKKAHYPCLFSLVKKGKLKNASEILHPEARRLSHIFDDIDAVDEIEFDEDNLPEEVIDLTRPADPYLEKHTSGHRVKKTPDISDILKKL